MHFLTQKLKINYRKCDWSLTTLLMILSSILSVICFIGWNLLPSTTEIIMTSNAQESGKKSFNSNSNCKRMDKCEKFEFVDFAEKESRNFNKYKIKLVSDNQDEKLLSYQDVILMLQSNIDFRNAFFDILRLGLSSDETDFAYFFEVLPITRNIYSTTPFEFVILPAPSLDGIKADRT